MRAQVKYYEEATLNGEQEIYHNGNTSGQENTNDETNDETIRDNVNIGGALNSSTGSISVAIIDNDGENLFHAIYRWSVIH